MKKLCKECKQIGTFPAFSKSTCEECEAEIITPTLSNYKACKKCSNKYNMCMRCGEKLK